MGSAEPGDLLAGRYRLQAVIGGGRMGVVWLAGDESLHRDVAVKEVLWPPQLDAAERETLRQRALREARTAARLNHPNIVGIYEVVEDDGRPWIVQPVAQSPGGPRTGWTSGTQIRRAGLRVLVILRSWRSGMGL